ncbi:hypothetical protein Ancab_002319 [Ancistrocladus abbreviatus]
MGIMHSARPHYGLQFHPESVATSYGPQMFKNFRDITVDYWLRQGASSRNNSHGKLELLPLPVYVMSLLDLFPLFLTYRFDTLHEQ